MLSQQIHRILLIHIGSSSEARQYPCSGQRDKPHGKRIAVGATNPMNRIFNPNHRYITSYTYSV